MSTSPPDPTASFASASTFSTQDQPSAANPAWAQGPAPDSGPTPTYAQYSQPQYTPAPYPAQPAKKLTRPRTGRAIGGVCAGIARYFGWDPTIVRIVAVASILLPGPQVIAYLLGWVFIPEDPA